MMDDKSEKVEAWLDQEEFKQFMKLVNTGYWGRLEDKGIRAKIVRVAINVTAEIYSNEDVKDLMAYYPEQRELDIVRHAVRYVNMQKHKRKISETGKKR
jgi:hypothetical protein